MLVSINKLSELTGRDRRTITKQLEDLPFVDGKKGAHLYESSEALPLIYRVDNLDDARAKQALSEIDVQDAEHFVGELGPTFPVVRSTSESTP